jgi:hypothetical protein
MVVEFVEVLRLVRLELQTLAVAVAVVDILHL